MIVYGYNSYPELHKQAALCKHHRRAGLAIHERGLLTKNNIRRGVVFFLFCGGPGGRGGDDVDAWYGKHKATIGRDLQKAVGAVVTEYAGTPAIKEWGKGQGNPTWVKPPKKK